MNLSEFEYVLPEERIAYYPSKERTESRLLMASRTDEILKHHLFKDIASYFQSGDVLVLNNTRVIPARLWGRKETGAQVEAVLLKDLGDNRWRVLLRPGGRIRKDITLTFGDNGKQLLAVVQDEPQELSPERVLQFQCDDLLKTIEEIGHVPLPPYIARSDEKEDRQRYQTVFAEHAGAIAAPTAGLHFDNDLLNEIRKKEVEIVCITLHVGYDSFRPVTVERIQDHRLGAESYSVGAEAAARINSALKEKRRIIACGTTSVRVLESSVRENGTVASGNGETDLFIYPPYTFRVVGGLITNFHLPKSSLLMLVSAFAGEGLRKKIYEEAIQFGYRFYSYGDAMLIL